MWLRNPPQNSEFCDRVLPQKKASDRRQASRCRETQEFCKTAMSLGFLTEEQASRVVQAQSQGRQFLPLCGFSVPLLILLANSIFADCSWLRSLGNPIVIRTFVMAGDVHAGFGRIRQQYPLLLRPQFLASPFNAYTRWKSLLYANDRLCGLGQQTCGLRHRMGSLGHVQQPAQMVATP